MFDHLSGQTLLVTGATGFIGSHLVRYLEQLPDQQLVVLSRQPRPANLTLDTTWVAVPLGSLTPQIWRDAGIEKIDTIFHLASFTPKTGAAGDDIEQVYEHNLCGTRTLLDNLPTWPSRVVFTSTLDVYAPPAEGTVLSEDSSINPKNLYAASKFFGEQLIQTYAHQQGFSYAILRYGHIFGPGEESYGKLIPLTIRQLLDGEAPTLFGDGSAGRDYLYVEDAIEATLRAAVSDVERLGPVNIVRGESSSIRAIVEELMELTGFNGSINFLPDKPNGYTLRFDNRKMHELLGDWPLVTLQEGLRRQVRYHQTLAVQ